MALVDSRGFQLTPDIVGSFGRGVAVRGQLQQQDIQRQEAETRQQEAQRLLGRQARERELLAQLGGGQTQQAAPAQLGQQAPPSPLDQLGAQPQQRQQQAQQALELEFPERAKAIQDAQKSRFDNLSSREKIRFESVVKGALEVQGLPPEQQLSRLKARRDALAENNIPTGDTDEVIAFLEAGDTQSADQLINQTVKAGEGFKLINNTTLARAEFDIKRRGAELRALEAEQRTLDLGVKRETNSIRQRELQLRLDEKTRAINQAKLNRQFEADNTINDTDNTIGTIDRLLANPGLESAAGIGSLFIFPTIPGSAAADFEAELEVLQSQAFLTQVKKMKGMGALSENEGKKLAAAVGALDLSQSDKSLRDSLGRIREQMIVARDRLKTKFGKRVSKTSRLESLSSADLAGMTDEELQALLDESQ